VAKGMVVGEKKSTRESAVARLIEVNPAGLPTSKKAYVPYSDAHLSLNWAACRSVWGKGGLYLSRSKAPRKGLEPLTPLRRGKATPHTLPDRQGGKEDPFGDFLMRSNVASQGS
jgi:hypothetical protein